MNESILLEKRNEIILWFGGWIFPQKSSVIIEKFGEEVLQLFADGYLQTSRSKIGTHPTMMKQVKGYVELTNRGWEIYEQIKPKE